MSCSNLFFRLGVSSPLLLALEVLNTHSCYMFNHLLIFHERRKNRLSILHGLMVYIYRGVISMRAMKRRPKRHGGGAHKKGLLALAPD
jgi:hypothetical protein